ncbi:PmbA [Ketogulonicigenium vulgare Y25]|uniref:Modulator of DNA gyrase protein n=1 Tax=Ketogulonicigenium vulgare (strain WSH-001) TaxID=759362 RepID=F9Y6L9_KETVW|nr:TldD/PmbA family protein [Ketogulonicigenium vulgare]ADO43881.1 PmbA [Ketogulonicigenium vulgare Y25]AEM42139.1 Modulator of DNA gyrase protein [Ketogulonicigenium vulgare WSH-001]AOZ55915.1 PmbA [Ketogulonicigenium vulgare]
MPLDPMSDRHDLARITAALLDAARKAGATSADAMAVAGTSVAIDVRDGRLEQAERSEGIDIGLRVMIGQRQAAVGASDARDITIERMAERAVAMAREAPEDRYIGLADPSQLASDLDMARLELYDATAEPDPSALESDARAAEEAAMNVDGVTQVQGTSAAYSHHKIHMAASNGFDAGYMRTGRNISCVAISGSGATMQRDWDADTRVFQADLRDPADIGRIAAERAVAMQGARKIASGHFPILFDERIATTLIGNLMNAVNGLAVARGSSFLRDAMGKQVLPAGMSLVEEPHRKRIGGSRLFDAEGIATQRRAIVEDGVLQSWTLDLASSRQLGLTTTANASRGTSSAPSPSAGNLRLTAGTASRADLIAQMGTGLLVTSFIGATINPNTGDYSRGASGFWVENGEIQFPVHEVTVAGNLREMLLNLVAANDGREDLSRVVPSLLVDGMTIAGA